jgi:microcystin-dependent protein
MRRIRLLACGLVLAALAPLPVRAQSEPYIGQLMLVAYGYCPNGWAEASGQLLAIAQNQALFALIGTYYGGNGQTNFALPDLRGRVPVHVGQGPGLTPRTIGEAGGTESVTLLQSQMPAHAHALLGTTEPADAASPTNAALATKARTTVYRAGAAPDTTLQGGSVAAAGGSQPHDNMPPYLAMRWCIALQGIFPTQNFAVGVEPASVASEPHADDGGPRRLRSRRFGR